MRVPEAVSSSTGPVAGVLRAVGQTPLVELRRLFDTDEIRVWAKLEASNPAGGSKARSATRIVEDAIAYGAVGPGTTVVESTSGNMGVGLAQACRYHGLRLIGVIDGRAHDSNVRAMRAFGAEVREVTEPDPVTGDLLTARLALVGELLETIPGAFWPDQYSNPSNPAAHADGTMREIEEALDGDLDYVFVATSTAGTLLGCIDHLHRRGMRSTRVIAVDSEGSALFGGHRGDRRLPGFGAGAETLHARTARPALVMRVSDLECVVGCRQLVAREAILAGGSSGGVVAAARRLIRTIPRGSRCALILPDGGTGYLETIYDDMWVSDALGVAPGEVARLVAGAAR